MRNNICSQPHFLHQDRNNEHATTSVNAEGERKKNFFFTEPGKTDEKNYAKTARSGFSGLNEILKQRVVTRSPKPIP